MKAAFFIGIDVGTQGARTVLVDSTGAVLARASKDFPLTERSREEQSPEAWWQACLACLHQMVDQCPSIRGMAGAIAVTSTSGTVIPLDRDNQPLHPAIMYSDPRSADAATRCRAAASALHLQGFTAFNSSCGLSKMVWYAEQFPGQAAKISRWVHAADYITARLSGRWDVTDYTNALKSGYDLHTLAWPSYLWERLPLQSAWLPAVQPSGTPLGRLLPALAQSLGCSGEITIVAPLTDGCASQVASGAVQPGSWNTTIGTTMVIKGVTRSEIRDPEGSLYSHRHPEGFWMPGGASNTGADWIALEFGRDLEALEAEARTLLPTGLLLWPLLREGERFPFVAPDARGFAPEGLRPVERFAAGMEGVAYLERLAYERIEQLSGEKIKAVFSAGGGSLSETWLSIRAHVLALPVYRKQEVSGAFGAAILAASKTRYSDIMEAAGAMARNAQVVRPDKAMIAQYEEPYRRFKDLLRRHGYINESIC